MRATEARVIIRSRLHRQCLAGSRHFADPVEAVRALVAVQAQELPEAKWALGQRTGCDNVTVERLLADGALVRMHVPRPTWHLIAREDVRLLLRVLGPRVHVANRFQYKQHGIDATTVARTQELLTSSLRDGEPRTRAELTSMMSANGVPDLRGPRLAHVLMHAELDALIVSGPSRGGQQTYQLLDHRVPPDLPAAPERELAVLVRRWFAGHGPATRHDLAWWSGLSLVAVDQGLAALPAGALHVTPDDTGKVWYAGPDQRPVPSSSPTRLLGTYDETMVAYRDLRGVSGSYPTADLQIRPVVIDGRVAGHWRRSFTARRIHLDVHLDRPLGARRQAELGAEARRYASFFDRELKLTVHNEPGALRS